MSTYKSRCAVCGSNIEDVVRHTHGSEEYHFCSQECRLEFINKPDDYEKVWKYFRKDGNNANAIKCAVCGETVSEEVAVKQEHTAVKQEHTSDDSTKKYFFCTEKHRLDFIVDPTSYEEMSGKHLS